MELVRGIRITDYCDQNNLSPRERLSLFTQVCHAIQHAHQKGIIHRDIKPSNILVTMHDGVPVPKVIDFGIAKATEQRLTDKTLFTAFEQFMGTPAYMSPEQAEMSGLDIDTRSDVYSLGVLLYELLTGKTPFDAKELLQAGLNEMRRTIREKEPARPSTCLSTMQNADLATVAKHRQSDAPKLIHLLRGDLDWIAMKTLEKDRTRRYETANGLAMDIQRHLNHEPVVAAPPSWSYLLSKTMRKHRRTVAVAATLVFLLVAGTTVSLWQAARAGRQATLAEARRREADASRQAATEAQSRAEKNAREATESEQSARRLLYASDMRLASQAWEDGNLSLMVSLLDAHQPKPGQPDPRGFEYFRLRELAKGEQEYVLHGHTNAVLGVAISPDGKWLASRSQTDTRLWDLAQRKPVAVWPSLIPSFGGLGGRCGVSFSYDSQYLAIETEAGLQLCQVSTLQTRMLATGNASRAIFSPVTNLIAFNSNVGWSNSEPVQIHVWDYLSEKEVGVAKDGGEIWLWSPDGSRLLSDQGDYMVRWWDAATMKCVNTNWAVGEFVFGATVTRDGSKMALAQWSGEIRLLPVAGGEALATFNSGDTREAALAFSPDGKSLATTSHNQAILIWNTATGRQVRELRGHHGKVRALAYSPYGNLLASGGEDGDVMLWNPAHPSSQFEISNQLTYVVGNRPKFSPDGKSMALADYWNGSRIFDSSNLEEKASLAGLVASYSPDGRQLAALAQADNGTELLVRQVDARSNRAAIYIDSAGLDLHALRAAELSPDGTFVGFTTSDAAENTGSLLCNAVTGEKIVAVATNSLDGWGNCFLPDGKAWICADGSKIRFWNLRSRANTRSLDCHEAVTCLALSADGKVLAAGREDYSILLWDLVSGDELGTLSGHQAEVWALAFSPDGRTLASGGEDSTIKLWNLATLREVASFPQDRAVCWLAFSPDNQMLVSGGFGSYEVWRAPRDGATAWSAPGLSTMNLPTNSIWRVPDGKNLGEFEKAKPAKKTAKP